MAASAVTATGGPGQAPATLAGWPSAPGTSRAPGPPRRRSASHAAQDKRGSRGRGVVQATTDKPSNKPKDAHRLCPLDLWLAILTVLLVWPHFCL